MEQLCLNGRTPSTANLKVGVFPRLLYGNTLTVGKEGAKVKSHQLFFHFKWLWKSCVSHRIGGALLLRHSCSINFAHHEPGWQCVANPSNILTPPEHYSDTLGNAVLTVPAASTSANNTPFACVYTTAIKILHGAYCCQQLSNDHGPSNRRANHTSLSARARVCRAYC